MASAQQRPQLSGRNRDLILQRQTLRSRPRPATLGRVCWGSWGPWLVGWAGWPAPPHWAPCPPPPPSASPGAAAAPALPPCWSSDCRCQTQTQRLQEDTFKGLSYTQVYVQPLPPPYDSPALTLVDHVISPHSGAQCCVELLLLVVLQVEGLQGVHGPIKEGVVQQHLEHQPISTLIMMMVITDHYYYTVSAYPCVWPRRWSAELPVSFSSPPWSFHNTWWNRNLK